MNDPLRVAFAILFPFLVGVVAVIAWFLWRSLASTPDDAPGPGSSTGTTPAAAQLATQPHRGGLGFDLRLVASWLALSAISDGLAWGALFAMVHILLFAFGTAMAWVGVAVSGVMLAAIPIGWAIVLRRWSRQHAR